MDFLKQKGLPLTEENLTAWQADLEAREEAAMARNQELKRNRAEVLKEYALLESKEEQLFRKRAAQSNKQWSRPSLFGGKYLFEIIIYINVIMFILSRIFTNLTAYTALFGPFITVKNEYYRLFTTMFMHANISHIFFNMYALYVLGSQLERLLGKKYFSILYFGSGILGASITYLVNPFILSVGASGAIFGLLGYVLYAKVFNYSSVTPEIQASLMTMLAINLLIALIPGSNIDIWSHIGGLIGGFLVGMVIGPGANYIRSKDERNLHILIGISGIGLLLVAVILKVDIYSFFGAFF